MAKNTRIPIRSPSSLSCKNVLARTLGNNNLLKNASTFLAFFGLINSQRDHLVVGLKGGLGGDRERLVGA